MVLEDGLSHVFLIVYVFVIQDRLDRPQLDRQHQGQLPTQSVVNAAMSAWLVDLVFAFLTAWATPTALVEICAARMNVADRFAPHRVQFLHVLSSVTCSLMVKTAAQLARVTVSYKYTQSLSYS